MKFHKEDIFNSATFNKNKNKYLAIIFLITYIILGAFNIYTYNKNNSTISVCVTKGKVWRNQQFYLNDKGGNIQEHKMTKAEYDKYAITNTKTGIKNKIVLWKDRDKIIGKYAGYTKDDHEYLLYPQIITTFIDSSRSVLYANPGKIIVDLDIDASNLSSLKAILRVGDKINIGCTYDDSYTMNITQGNKTSSKELETIVVDQLFTGVVIADILNAQGESILDYYNYLNNLNAYQRKQIEASDEYAKKIKVQTLLLALTPQEQKKYREYSVKQGIKFYIDLPHIDE